MIQIEAARGKLSVRYAVNLRRQFGADPRPPGCGPAPRTGSPDVVELWDWTLQPGDGFDGEAHPIGTDDTVMFQGTPRTATAARATSQFRFIMVVLQPGEGDSCPRPASPRRELPVE